MDQEFDTDRLHLLPDESLVSLAVQERSGPACHVLILRHHPWVSNWIIARGRKLRMSVDDIEDATQQAVCVLVEEAIPGYHWHRQMDPSFKPFREYLACVQGTRFQDFVRRLRRESHRFGGSLENLPFAKRAQSQRNAQIMYVNPLMELLRHEYSMALDSFLDRLSNRERELWDLILLKASQREMSSKLCVPYGTVRRRRHRLLKRVWRLVERHSPFAGSWGSLRSM